MLLLSGCMYMAFGLFCVVRCCVTFGCFAFWVCCLLFSVVC